VKKNHDPLIVVLDVEQYYRLLNSAEIGDSEAGGNAAKEVAHHARRFNPHLQTAHAAEIAAERRRYAKARKRVRELIRRIGQPIWYRMGAHYAPGIIAGPSDSKLLIRVRGLPKCRGVGLMHQDVRDMNPSNLVDAFPDGAVYQDDEYWRGTYLSP